MEWASLTRAQGGMVSRAQLRASGLSERQVDTLVEARRLDTTTTRGVYRAVGAPATRDTEAWHAVLATRSPLSFVTAAQWWAAPVEPDGLIHVTRFDRRRLTWPERVRVHRVDLRPADVCERNGMGMTTRTETLLDCLGWLDYNAAASLADRAIQRGWLTVGAVEGRIATRPGRWGNRQLRLLLPALGDGAAAESERRMHTLLRDAGISGWKANLTIVINGSRWEIDVAFPEHRLAIEIDGRRYHSEDDRFQTDRTKQNALVGAGWLVLRFTWNDIVFRPHEVIARISALLAA